MFGNLYNQDTPFQLWIPTDMPDDEIIELLDICGEVHKGLCTIQQGNIDIWEGIELLEQVVPNIDDYLEYVESRT